MYQLLDYHTILHLLQISAIFVIIFMLIYYFNSVKYVVYEKLKDITNYYNGHV